MSARPTDPHDLVATRPFSAGYTPRVRLRRPLLYATVVLMLPLCGCEKPLLTRTEERSPFDRYDHVRNQGSDQRVMNEYGRMKPNLRERLGPKD